MPTLINPNSVTSTRIPMAIMYYSSSTASIDNTLRKPNNNFVMGVRDGYQYDSTFKAGLTPGDDGSLNDGGTYSISSTATSRFIEDGISLINICEWWENKYVIYCGKKDSFIYSINVANSDSELINLVGLYGGDNSTREQSLLWLDNSPNFLCVNTNYQTLYLGEHKSLILLIDFGFVPSYPKCGDTVHNLVYYDNDSQISGFSFDGGTYSYKYGSTFSYGTMYFNGTTGDIPKNLLLQSDTFAIDYWIKAETSGTVMSNTSGSGGYYITDSFFRLYLTTGSSEDFIFGANYGIWTNIVITYRNRILRIYKNAVLVVSVDLIYDYLPDSSDFKLGSMAFAGYISSVKLYNEQLTDKNVNYNYAAARASGRFDNS